MTSHGDSVCLSFGVRRAWDAYLADFVQPVIDDAAARCENGTCRADESGCSAVGTRRPSASWLLLPFMIVLRSGRGPATRAKRER